MPVSLTLRNVKGSPLTNQEVDDNFSSIAAAVVGSVYVTSYLTGTGTHNCQPGAIYVEVFCTGGGGGGGSADGDGVSASVGGGGGGGGTAHRFLTAAQVQGGTWTVGAGGTSGSLAGISGGSGGTTTFANTGITTISGGGGGGGTGTGLYAPSNGAFNGGSGGTNSGYDLNYQGMEGSPGIGISASTLGMTQGNGGDSLWGGGASTTIAANTGTTTNGTPGTFGGGGSGGKCPASTAGAYGGTGGSGLVRIVEYLGG